MILGWSLLVVSTVGMASNIAMWLMNLISSRAMLGVTLALSWLALVFTAAEFLQVAHNRDADQP